MIQDTLKIRRKHSHEFGSELVSKRAKRASGACELSEQCGVDERVSGASERASRQASDPVLTSRMKKIPNLCETERKGSVSAQLGFAHKTCQDHELNFRSIDADE